MISNELKMEIFEKMTGTRPLACFDENTHLTTFVVAKGLLTKTLGKGAANASKVKLALATPVRIIESAENLADFSKNVCLPIDVKVSVEKVDDFEIVTIFVPTFELRGRLIGRQAGILRNNEKIVKHFFSSLKELKVEHRIEETI